MPHDPAKSGSKSEHARKARAELGLPLLERERKSPNAQTEDLGNGQRRTKHRFLLTTPESRRALYEEMKRAQQADGSFGKNRIFIQETAADRYLDASEHRALCWFLREHIESNFQSVGVLDYTGEQRKSKPDTKAGSASRTLYVRVRAKLSRKQRDFLDWLARHEYVITEAGEVEGHIRKGRRIIGSRDDRRGEGGLDGYLAAIADAVDYWRSKCATQLKRRAKDGLTHC